MSFEGVLALSLVCAAIGVLFIYFYNRWQDGLGSKNVVDTVVQKAVKQEEVYFEFDGMTFKGEVDYKIVIERMTTPFVNAVEWSFKHLHNGPKNILKLYENHSIPWYPMIDIEDWLYASVYKHSRYVHSRSYNSPVVDVNLSSAISGSEYEKYAEYMAKFIDVVDELKDERKVAKLAIKYGVAPLKTDDEDLFEWDSVQDLAYAVAKTGKTIDSMGATDRPPLKEGKW